MPLRIVEDSNAGVSGRLAARIIRPLPSTIVARFKGVTPAPILTLPVKSPTPPELHVSRKTTTRSDLIARNAQVSSSLVREVFSRFAALTSTGQRNASVSDLDRPP